CTAPFKIIVPVCTHSPVLSPCIPWQCIADTIGWRKIPRVKYDLKPVLSMQSTEHFPEQYLSPTIFLHLGSLRQHSLSFHHSESLQVALNSAYCVLSLRPPISSRPSRTESIQLSRTSMASRLLAC